MKKIRTILYILIQCTWGIFQTFIGFLYFLKYIKCEHQWFHGSVVTYFDGWSGGISLGMFIFVAQNSETMQKDFLNKNIAFNNKEQLSLKVHEYGHTIQSLIFGPLYLIIIGMPSSIWANSKSFKQKRKIQSILYTSFWCEKWANKLGETVTKEKAWQH